MGIRILKRTLGILLVILPDAIILKCLYSVTQISQKLSDSNEIGTHNHLVRRRTLRHLAKLAIND